MFKIPEILTPQSLNVGMKTLVSLVRGKNPPTLVYQMGKVGSTSIWSSLQLAGIDPVFQVHRLNPANIKEVRIRRRFAGITGGDELESLILRQFVLKSKKPYRIVTLIREPVSRNISAFFENLQMHYGRKFDVGQIDLEDAIDRFLNEYPHYVPSLWFDTELKSTTGFDIYSKQFPKSQGWIIHRTSQFDVLAMKLEIDDGSKEQALNEFFDRSDICLQKANVGIDKNYALLYRKFKRNISLPSSYVHDLTTTRYARHFYTDEELEEVRKRWS